MNLRKTSLAILIFVVSNANGQYSPDQIDSIVNVAMSKFKVAGLSVGVIKDGKQVLSKGYGVQSVEGKEPVNSQTNFAIASNTKAFTTTALAILVEDGKLAWTDKVKQHIPEFTMYNPYVTENFNIQDLLTHRSGLGLGIGDLMFFPDGSNFTMDDLLSSFQYFKPVSAFRTKFDYDNLLYMVAGEVIKRVSGMSYEDFITQRILKPLGMAHSFVGDPDAATNDNLATAHANLNGTLKILPPFKHSIGNAAGGIYSSSDDMLKWIDLQLNHGLYGPGLGDTLFHPASQRELWSIHTVTQPSRNPRYKSHFAGYGLGFGLSDVLGNMQVEHTGGLPGMLSRVVMIPDLNLGIVILTNTSEDGAAVFQSLSQTILDGYLGLDKFDWISRYADAFSQRQEGADAITRAVWKTVEVAKNTKITDSNFVGQYRDPWFGIIEVYKKGDELWMKSHRSPRLTGRMYYYKANTFAVKWNYQDMDADAFAMFQLDENGKAQSIQMKGISPNIDFSFDFQDLELDRIKQ